MIVKVQIPLWGEDNLALVYNEDRSILCRIEATKELRADVGERMKAYYEAEIADDGAIELGEQVEWQEW